MILDFLFSRMGAAFVAAHLLILLTVIDGFLFLVDPANPLINLSGLALSALCTAAIGGRQGFILFCFLACLVGPSAWRTGTGDLVLFHSLALAFACLVFRTMARWRWAQMGLLALFIVGFVLVENVQGVYRSLMGTNLGQAQLLALVGTNWDEAYGFLAQKPAALPFLCLFVLGSAIAPFAVRRLTQTKLNVMDYAASWILLNILLYAMLHTISFGYDRSVLYSMLGDALTQERRFEAAAADRHAHPKQTQTFLRAPKKPALVIVAIGESATRHHWSLYGYNQPTTPLMQIRRGELAIFDNAIASYSATLFSLKRALTLATVESGKEYDDAGMFSIIELLRGAGVKTHWLSNQAKWGLWGVKLWVLANGADDVRFVNERTHLNTKIPKFEGIRAVTDTGVIESTGRVITTMDFAGVFTEPDGILLDQIKTIVADEQGPAVLFVHLMGSHFPYERRYPNGFGRFSAVPESNKDLQFIADNRANYDNSILYTDWMLNQMIEALAQKEMPTALLYFSDHGEAVDLGRQHDPSDYTPAHVEVPLITWFSPAYRAAFPGTIDGARHNEHAPFMLDQLPQVIADLAQIGGPFYQPQHSLLNTDFKPSKRLTLDGKVDYDRNRSDYCAIVLHRTGFNLSTCKN